MSNNMVAAPSLEERVDCLRADVNALYRLIPDDLERQQEQLRQDRWHATYNTVLVSGIANTQWDIDHWTARLIGIKEP